MNICSFIKFINCCRSLTPSPRILRKFKKYYGYLIEKIHENLLKKAEKEKLTDFNYISIDGTIVKANNSPYMIR